MRVGRIGYINCYPVYSAIDRGVVASPGTMFVTGTPSELNNLLAAGELDALARAASEEMAAVRAAAAAAPWPALEQAYTDIQDIGAPSEAAS